LKLACKPSCSPSSSAQTIKYEPASISVPCGNCHFSGFSILSVKKAFERSTVASVLLKISIQSSNSPSVSLIPESESLEALNSLITIS